MVTKRDFTITKSLLLLIPISSGSANAPSAELEIKLYNLKRPETVYCESCYLKEVY